MGSPKWKFPKCQKKKKKRLWFHKSLQFYHKGTLFLEKYRRISFSPLSTDIQPWHGQYIYNRLCANILVRLSWS